MPEIQNKNIDRLEKHVAAANVNLSEGVATPTSLAEAEARFARAKADRALIITGLENAKDYKYIQMHLLAVLKKYLMLVSMHQAQK